MVYTQAIIAYAFQLVLTMLFGVPLFVGFFFLKKKHWKSLTGLLDRFIFAQMLIALPTALACFVRIQQLPDIFEFKIIQGLVLIQAASTSMSLSVCVGVCLILCPGGSLVPRSFRRANWRTSSWWVFACRFLPRWPRPREGGILGIIYKSQPALRQKLSSVRRAMRRTSESWNTTDSPDHPVPEPCHRLERTALIGFLHIAFICLSVTISLKITFEIMLLPCNDYALYTNLILLFGVIGPAAIIMHVRDQKRRDARKMQGAGVMFIIIIGLALCQGFQIFGFVVLLVIRAQLSAATGDDYEDNQWGYGQILAVFVWLPTIIDLMRWIYSTAIGKRKGAFNEVKSLEVACLWRMAFYQY